jgi:uncharacterized protein HemX
MADQPKGAPVIFSAKRWLDSRAADRAGKVFAAVALSVSLVLGYAVYQQNRCQAAYAAAANASQRARSEAAEKDRQAQDILFKAIADRPREAISALREYNTARDEADAQRDQNPVPPAPSTRCG